MFTLRPEVDWNALRDQFRPKATEAKTAVEFAQTLADMLRPLRDLHVWVRVGTNEIPVFNRPRAYNANPAAWSVLLPPLQAAGGDIQWAVTPDNIGFVSIRRWANPGNPTEFDRLLEEMRNTRGLILDVRRNGGGAEPLAREVAGRFLERQFVYAFSQSRNGPSHGDLGPKQPRRAQPRGPWRYDRPVVLLIGERCLSSNESFVAMMTGATNVTTMGDHTGGSSGNPKMLSLPFEISVSVPRWIDYLPDGTPLDERGVQPQIRFAGGPGAFEGERDDLLVAALNRLRNVPLPKEPIAGPTYFSPRDQPRAITKAPTPISEFSAILKEEAADPHLPHVISVSPADGATNVPSSAELRIRFDRAMDPLALQLEWQSGGFLSPCKATYDVEKHEFKIPLDLLPGSHHQILLNRDFFFNERSIPKPGNGFRAADGNGGARAAAFVWSFHAANSPAPANGVRPQAAKVSPASGTDGIPMLSFLEIEFDREMLPPTKAFPYVVQSPPGVRSQLPDVISFASYDTARHMFRLPIVLTPKMQVAFTLSGFRGVDGVPAEPLKLEYTAGGELFDASEFNKSELAARNPDLLGLLARMRDARMKIHSVDERVQLESFGQEDGVFTTIDATVSEFRWGGAGQIYGDVSTAMNLSGAFRIGSNGEHWWFYFWDERTSVYETCPLGDIHETSLSVCDPFELTRKTPEQAAADLQLSYIGLRSIEGRACHVVERWLVQRLKNRSPSIQRIQWWIDAETFRPREVTQFGASFISRMRFFYDAINGPKTPEKFMPSVAKGVVSHPPVPLDAKYTNRFVILHDGSDGNMRARWGRSGPGGRNSSGLN